MPTHTVAECAHKTQPSMPSSLCLSSEVPADLRVPHHQYHPCGKSKCWVCLLPQDDLISARANILFFFFFVICIQKLSFPFLPSRSNNHFGNNCFLPIYSSYILLLRVGLKTCLEHASNFFFPLIFTMEIFLEEAGHRFWQKDKELGKLLALNKSSDF